jgi:hypothetical protein
VQADKVKVCLYAAYSHVDALMVCSNHLAMAAEVGGTGEAGYPVPGAEQSPRGVVAALHRDDGRPGRPLAVLSGIKGELDICVASDVSHARDGICPELCGGSGLLRLGAKGRETAKRMTTPTQCPISLPLGLFRRHSEACAWLCEKAHSVAGFGLELRRRPCRLPASQVEPTLRSGLGAKEVGKI